MGIVFDTREDGLRTFLKDYWKMTMRIIARETRRRALLDHGTPISNPRMS